MNGEHARILVVDDDDACRYSVSRTLRAEGHEIVDARTGRRALEVAREARLDLVVLDVHLPDMLGFEVADQLRQDPATRAVAILMISASFTGADAHALGLRRGADAYLTHPVEPQVLGATVQALLRMRSAEQRAQEALVEQQRLLAEARSATAERDRLVEQLREESRRKNEFLAVLSHELRNPLAPIRNGVTVIDRSPPGSAQAKRACEIIDRQVSHMARLIDDLLDITRIARGKIQLRVERLELDALVRRAIDDHREVLRKAGVEVELALTDAPLPVHGDPTRLAQVIGNLLQNAAKFTPAGGRVFVSLEASGASVAVLRVRDTGVGISEDVMQHLFEPFVQSDKTLDRSGGGLGLGLALAKGIVELHGGTISARSEGSGLGAELVVYVPLEPPEAARPVA